MDLSIPSELLQVQETVRKFVSRELAPLEQQVDEADWVDEAVMKKLRARAVELGIFGFNIPAEHGGGGVGPLGEVLISMEMGRTSVTLAETLGRLPLAIIFARGAQREWFLGPALRGEKIVANALTEPSAGSDFGGLQTKAVRDGDGWRISGSKTIITGADNADYLILLAVTDPSAPLRSRFTTFILDRHDPALQFSSRFKKMGWRGHSMNSFAIDDCRVAADRVLGEVGAGFATIMASVNAMRLSIAGRCVGAAEELLRMSRDYANKRKTFGSLLADHQAIQFKIADMDVELECARLLVLAGAWKAERGDPDLRIAASRAKLYATEMAGRAADQAMQIHGGYGYTSDLPIERFYRDLRGYRIGEGTSEIQRIQIARHVLANG